jgi:hypothetical protein
VKWLLLIIFSFLFVVTVYASERTETYDKHWNRTGYKIRESGRTVVYDKHWNRVGYEKKGVKYDKNWNRTGNYKEVHKRRSR